MISAMRGRKQGLSVWYYLYEESGIKHKWSQVQCNELITDPLIQLCVHSHDKNDGSVWAAQWSQQQETGEVGVVQVAAAVIYPRAVVVHFHHTPVGRGGRGGEEYWGNWLVLREEIQWSDMFMSKSHWVFLWHNITGIWCFSIQQYIISRKLHVNRQWIFKPLCDYFLGQSWITLYFLVTCYTCGNGGIWGLWILGTLCNIVGTGHPLHSPVSGPIRHNLWSSLL